MGPTFYERALEIFEYQEKSSGFFRERVRNWSDLSLEEQKSVLMNDTALRRRLGSLIHSLYNGGDKNGQIDFQLYSGKFAAPLLLIRHNRYRFQTTWTMVIISVAGSWQTIFPNWRPIFFRGSGAQRCSA